MSARRKDGRGVPVETALPVTWSGAVGTAEGKLALGPDAALWDEFSPALYELTAALAPTSVAKPGAAAAVERGPPSHGPAGLPSGGARSTVPSPIATERGPSGADPAPDTRRLVFGLRDFAMRGTQFAINGRPVFIRGTLDCCIFPKTGHPPTDVAEWKRIVGVAKAHGLNLIRFHSWCPPEAAFIAADELGFYLHVEASSWANNTTTLGDGKPVDAWTYAETDRILRHYGNHPSFVLMAQGNEPGGKNHKAYLAKWVEHYAARDP
ncbi:MAG: hypothetical protein BWK77_06800, partial [Verrucomicrobia bacterium A1]